MDIHQESASDFRVGHGGADAASRPIVEPEYSMKAYKGVRVRAATANTVVIYVGPAGVSEETGYPLPAGEELSIPIEQPSRIHVTASPADNCEQTVTLSGEIAGDTFTLSFEDETTEAIDVTAAAATVESALLALSTIGTGNCSVSGSAGGPYTVEFTGDLAKTDVGLMTGTGYGVNEVQNVEVSEAVADDTIVLTFDGQSTGELAYDSTSAQIETALESLSNIGAGNVSVSDGSSGWDVEFIGALAGTDTPEMTGVGGKNEIQTVSLADTTDTGTFTITYAGQTTTDIAYDAAAGTVQSALEGLSNIDVGDVSVTGGPGPDSDWVVEFTGSLARTNVVLMTTTPSCGRNEKQTISIDSGTTGGSFTLTFESQTTNAIPFSAEASTIKTELELLGTIDTVNVTGGPGPANDWVVEFTGSTAITDVSLMTGDGSSLEGGSTTVSITETVKGVTETVSVEETITGNSATVTVTTTQTGDETCTVTVEKVSDITADSQYSWIAV